MKINYLKLKHWLLVSLAGMLGINVTSCVMEYGCPMADYNIKGKVTDPNGNPVSGIKVDMIGFSSTTTSDDGSYNMNTRVEPYYPAETVDIAFVDIDSTENGLFKNDTVPVVFQYSEFTGGNGRWYEGSITKTLNVSLQPVEE